jgi:hypothetical protein
MRVQEGMLRRSRSDRPGYMEAGGMPGRGSVAGAGRGFGAGGFSRAFGAPLVTGMTMDLFSDMMKSLNNLKEEAAH